MDQDLKCYSEYSNPFDMVFIDFYFDILIERFILNIKHKYFLGRD